MNKHENPLLIAIIVLEGSVVVPNFLRTGVRVSVDANGLLTRHSFNWLRVEFGCAPCIIGAYVLRICNGNKIIVLSIYCQKVIYTPPSQKKKSVNHFMM